MLASPAPQRVRRAHPTPEAGTAVDRLVEQLGGLGMFTKVLALELAEHGITVNSVAPGEIATEMTGMDEAEAFAQQRPGNPVGRPATSTRWRR